MKKLSETLCGFLSWDRAVITDALSDEDIDLLMNGTITHPEKVMVVVDHDTPAGSVAAAEKQKKLLAYARENGLSYRCGQGIGYYLAMENLSPGDIVISNGERVSTVGAAGAIGITLSAMELKKAFESGAILLDAPRRFVTLEGELPRHVSASDLALVLIGEGGYEGALCAVYGPQLRFAEKAALCNLLGGTGAGSVFFTDEKPEKGKVYDLASTRPMAVLPGGFGEIIPASHIDGLRVNQVFIGGCAGGNLASLRETAGIFEGHHVSTYVRTLISPATNEILAEAMDEGIIETLMNAGALIMNPGCGACWAQSQGRCDEKEVFVTTGSINLENWAGKKHNNIYITSVERAAKAALSGSLYEN